MWLPKTTYGFSHFDQRIKNFSHGREAVRTSIVTHGVLETEKNAVHIELHHKNC